ncbi:MAG: flagellar biosynthetic protein FliR [Clostridium sp.]|nr:flagellar biosynthetic protein FliR [Acetatifactor muris]MCM1562240.1 flagellar biosynthetic protein FliR [Clostridium sp.]
MIDFSFSMYDLEYFLLILVRVSCFVFIAPFFSMNNTPARVRIALSVFVSILLHQALTPADAIIYETVMDYAILVMKEAVAGLLIGFGSNICMSILNLAGAIADMETGLSMVTLIDPNNARNQVSITGVLYQYAFTMMLIATGMYRYLLSALADSFELIPIGGIVLHSDSLLNVVIRFMSDYVIIGFRIVLPIFCVILLLNAILGVLAKVSPQMNMFAVGMQLKVITGLSVLFFTMELMPGASDFIYREMQDVMSAFVEAIRP